MTDKELLELINEDKLRITYPDLSVWIWHGGWGRWKLKKPQLQQGNRSNTWRYTFRFGPRENRRTVYRNRLVWLHWHRDIPERVDHIDGDTLNDHPGNLQHHSQYESAKQGNQKQADDVFNELCAWFDYIAFCGEVPDD